MIKRIAILLFFTGLISCSNYGSDKPEGLLDEKLMTIVLSDMHVSQMSLNNRIKSDNTDITADDYFEVVLRKHQITRADFLTSLKYYSDNPEILNVVYDSVLVRLNRLQQ